MSPKVTVTGGEAINGCEAEIGVEDKNSPVT